MPSLLVRVLTGTRRKIASLATNVLRVPTGQQVSLVIAFLSLTASFLSYWVASNNAAMQQEALTFRCILGDSSPVHFFNIDEYDKSFSKNYKLNFEKPVFMSAPWRLIITNISIEPTSISQVWVPHAPYSVVSKPPAFSSMESPLWADDKYDSKKEIDLPKLIPPGDSLTGYLMGALQLITSKQNIRRFSTSSSRADVDRITMIVHKTIFDDDIISDGDSYQLTEGDIDDALHSRFPNIDVQQTYLYGIIVQVTTTRGRRFLVPCSYFF